MRLASPPPAYCASCYAQRPDERHVDFDAAYDGPVIPGAPRVAIDDLVICEPCLRAAAGLLGYAPAGEAEGKVADLEEKLSEAAKRAYHAEQKLAAVERSLDHTPKRRGRPPKNDPDPAPAVA